MDDTSTWPTKIDRAILTEFAESGADYPALVASRRGLHLDTVRNRCDHLAETGAIERVSEEAVYRITDQGERRVERAQTQSGEHAVPGADE